MSSTENHVKQSAFPEETKSAGDKNLQDNRHQTTVETADKSSRKIGGLAGSLKYMADDFDAPLDDFQEYM
jgi:hypothetical protein